jgi:serine O-acetyltransferase
MSRNNKEQRVRQRTSGEGLAREIGARMPEIVAGLAHCRNCPVGLNTEKGLNLAGQQAVVRVLDDLISVLFPGCHGREPIPQSRLKSRLERVLTSAATALCQQVQRAFEFECRERHCADCDQCGGKAREAVSHFLKSLPEVQRILQRDITAAYEGDPAARSTMEVVMSYPGFYAVVVHRLAHLLYEKQVPLIPRVMSERAHSRTGIDIHPGAKIGPGFFIDHGTGVVIGETCVIGENVKLYQGVTLGALSFEKDKDGKLIKGVKRHPNVEDNVVIYAGATILGGLTTIGAGSEIGGNVWLTHSVPPGSRVYNRQPKPLIRRARPTRGGNRGQPADGALHR